MTTAIDFLSGLSLEIYLFWASAILCLWLLYSYKSAQAKLNAGLVKVCAEARKDASEAKLVSHALGTAVYKLQGAKNVGKYCEDRRIGSSLAALKAGNTELRSKIDTLTVMHSAALEDDKEWVSVLDMTAYEASDSFAFSEAFKYVGAIEGVLQQQNLETKFICTRVPETIVSSAVVRWFICVPTRCVSKAAQAIADAAIKGLVMPVPDLELALYCDPKGETAYYSSRDDASVDNFGEELAADAQASQLAFEAEVKAREGKAREYAAVQEASIDRADDEITQ